MSEVQQSRRDFLKLLGAGGALVVTVPLAGCASSPSRSEQLGQGGLANAFIRITPASDIEFYLPRAEMGQGVVQGLTVLVAEELSTPPEQIDVQFAPVDKAYSNPDFSMQATGGSTSMKVHYLPLRQAAANIRQALLEAASAELGVDAAALRLQDGQLVAPDGSYPIGKFVARAQQRPLPQNAPLKPEADFVYIGKDNGVRVDARKKSTGQADFGIDTEFDGLRRAVVKRCPVVGGRPASFDAAPALASPGVIKVVEIEHGVAVIAQSYWQAKRAAARLEVQWDLPALAQFNSDDLPAQLRQALQEQEGEEAERSGAGADALDKGAKRVEASYWAPYLAHATMEPMNCAIKLQGESCEVWAGTQTPQVARGLIANYLGIDAEAVTIHNTFLGGGFGRRLSADYMLEACMVARAADEPVQVVWSREDDMRHDVYRPAALANFTASLDDQGMIDTWTVKRAGPNIMPYAVEENLPGLAPGFVPDSLLDWLADRSHSVFENWTVDFSSVEGLAEDYDVPNKEVRHVTVDPGLPCGFLRSVGHSFSGFFKESFVDELAHAAGRDPVEFRLAHSTSDQRFAEVLRVAADKGHWGAPRVAGASQGVAVHTSFESRVAQVVELTVEGGEITVHRVCCVVDCGRAVTPDVVRAQMEGCIIFGLSAALYGRIDIEEGAVVQSNFHDYQVLRMAQTPEIDVHIIDSTEPPTGVGEPGLPPIAAAVANAVYAATGQRLRSLPLAPA